VALLCDLGFRIRAETGIHPIGLAEVAYRCATWVSLLLFVWAIIECKVAKLPDSRLVAVLVFSLLLVLLTLWTAEGLLIRE
jgi:hypothetical protein